MIELSINFSKCLFFFLFSFQVNPEQRQQGLLVTGVGEDGVLDFGDCYSGNGTCQLLTLRNVTQEVRSTLNVEGN